MQQQERLSTNQKRLNGEAREVKKTSRHLEQRISSPPLPSTSWKSHFNWCDITVGIRTVAGETWEKKQSAVTFPDAPTRMEIIDVSEYRPKKIPSPKWRECIKKVWEIDPLSCPKCGSEMKIISFINEAEAISKILEHLGLWEEKTPLERAPPDLTRNKSCEPYDDDWPQ